MKKVSVKLSEHLGTIKAKGKLVSCPNSGKKDTKRGDPASSKSTTNRTKSAAIPTEIKLEKMTLQGNIPSLQIDISGLLEWSKDLEPKKEEKKTISKKNVQHFSPINLSYLDMCNKELHRFSPDSTKNSGHRLNNTSGLLKASHSPTPSHSFLSVSTLSRIKQDGNTPKQYLQIKEKDEKGMVKSECHLNRISLSINWNTIGV